MIQNVEEFRTEFHFQPFSDQRGRLAERQVKVRLRACQFLLSSMANSRRQSLNAERQSPPHKRAAIHRDKARSALLLPGRSRLLQNLRRMPPLATTLCWVLEVGAALRLGFPDRKSRTSPRKPISRKSR